ncbi:MAG TPA: AAA family ATPase, partial [Syntrophorhabdales bacterium]|nr:AAA family ATPase [Syntrophorhabdales bacterium]
MDEHIPVITSVASGKGGVGKTFVTINLAALLASKGKRVLAVDCDLGLANMDIMLGLDPALT